MFTDARELPGGDALAYDLVIVGAGMAGITIADRLRPSGARICLLEAGGVDPELSAQRLYQGASVGRPYFGLDRCRFRVLGGSSVLWGGWSRPLDPDDFDARGWIALSGWPITAGELAPDYGRAARLLGLETDSFEAGDWGARLPPPPPIGAPEFEPGIIQHGRIDFGERFGSDLAAAENVTVLLHANVTELRADRHGATVNEAVVATLAGTRFTVRAVVFVLAAGGIENPRLLLASRSSRPDGIGNESDFVGRCFMDHLHVASGYVDPTNGAGLPPFFEHPIGGTSAAHGMLVPTPESRHQRRLPTCSISLDVVPSVSDVIPRIDWPPLLTTAPVAVSRRLQREHPALSAHARRASLGLWKAAHRPRAARRAYRAAHGPRSTTLSLFTRAEQTPNPDSRITLGPRRDRLGGALPRLDWRIDERDLAAMRVWRETLDDSLRRAGLGHVVAPREDWADRIVGGPHHMGTTRMSTTPAEGVVDADCRVHTVENLYVAGSSVFTTGGHANPSLTILALALRLADHLRERLC